MLMLANTWGMLQLQAKSEALPSPAQLQKKAFFCRNQLRSQLKAKIPEIGFYQDWVDVDTQMVLVGWFCCEDEDPIFCQQM